MHKLILVLSLIGNQRTNRMQNKQTEKLGGLFEKNYLNKYLK